jgi:hypothetical protein
MKQGNDHSRRPLRLTATALAGVTLTGIAAWGLYTGHQSALPEAGPSPVLAQPAPAAPADAQTMPPMPAVLPVGAQRLRIPSLNVQAAATPESVHSGVLGVPGDPAEVGWWMPSTAELVIDGHVDMQGTGPGALFRLQTIRPGAAVTVQTADGAEHWTVDGVRTYQKGYLPAELFNGQGPRLLIITCGGPFNWATRHYQDNIIAYASLS